MKEAQDKQTVEMDLGMLQDCSFEQYLATDALSRSALWAFRQSPWHYVQSMENPRESTPQTELGTMFHTLVLEVGEYAKRYRACQGPEKPKGLRKGTKKYDEWKAEYDKRNDPKDPRRIVTVEEQKLVSAMMESVLRCEVVTEALDAEHDREISAFWEDESTEILCKARADIYVPGAGMLLDIKTMEDISDAGFARACDMGGNHLQDVMYCDGFGYVTDWHPEPMLFVLVETKPPFMVRVVEVDEDSRVYAQEQYRFLLERFAWHKSQDDWQRFPDGVSTVKLWARTTK